MSIQRVHRKTKGVHNVCTGRRREYTKCVWEDDGADGALYRQQDVAYRQEDADKWRDLDKLADEQSRTT